MKTPEDRPAQYPDPAESRKPRESRPTRADDAGLAGYQKALDRSLAELDAAMEAQLPVLGTDAEQAAGLSDDASSFGPPARRRHGTEEWDRPAVLPYLTATLLAVVSMTILVAATTLPAAGVFQIGLTFLAVAMVVRRLEDAPQDSDNPVVAWLHDRAMQLEGKFGVEFYGVAALTSFLRAEVDIVTGLSLDGLLANPIGTAISWFVSALVESILNAVWAALWWFELMQRVDGLPLLGAIIGAGWLVWRVLDITPAPEDD